MSSCGVNLATAIILVFSIGTVMALQCYKCGLYNDGVGSITPCINDTNMPLKDCPGRDHKFCIKYQSEGTTIRDCVAECTEKEDWGSKIYCCNSDGCNSANLTKSSWFLFIAFTIIFMFFSR